MSLEATPSFLTLLQSYGAGAVCLLTCFEAVVIPFPTPPLIMAAGAFLVPHGLSWHQAFVPLLLRVAIPGAAGTTVGSLVFYALCYWGGRKMIDRYGRWMKVSWEDIQRMAERFHGQIAIAVFIARATPMFPMSLISASAGILRMPAPAFLCWSFAGTLLRYLTLGYAGFLGRNLYDLASTRVNGALLAATAVFVLLLALAVLALRGRRRKVY
jgi:membrane protein DedA with SNARE-associated domain